MNYLAHIFLSGNDSQVQLGNFIGDFVKGSQLNNYPERIRKGIRMHRAIDSYTDSHKVVSETVDLLRPAFGRYSAIVTDMYFDYFLALDFQVYSHGKSLNRFSYRFYLSVLIHYRQLPNRVKRFIFHFVLTNRLSRYSTPEGLKDSLKIMAQHKIPALDPEKINIFLLENHDVLQKRFHLFFPDVIEYVKGEL